MAGHRKLTAILAADVAGYSRLASADEDRTLARLRALRSDLIDPAVALHNGHVVKRTGDGTLVEFRSAVDAVKCGIEIQSGMVERNAGLPPERRIEFRIGIHIGDVVEESDGDLMGDGVNIAARLEGVARPGTICLSEDAWRLVKPRLDLAVSDLGEIELKNIATRVRAYALPLGVAATAAGARAPVRAGAGGRRRHAAWVLAAAAVVLLASGAAGRQWFQARRAAGAAPARAAADAAQLSIVVLPFTNQSNDPSQDYFADGITDNLTTDLSRVRNSFVIARNTAFAFKGKTVEVKEVSADLGVRYVLQGTVRRDQDRVRVNTQLVDGRTGALLWAERFEESVGDVFELEDRVVARLTNTLGYELVKAEAKASAHSHNPGVIDLVMRGWAMVAQPPNRTINDAARGLFEQALRMDPNDPDALAGVARTNLADYSYAWAAARADNDKSILDPADRALAAAPDNVWAYHVKSTYLYLSRRAAAALAVAQAGLAVSPSFAPLYGARGGAEISLGRFEPAVADLQQAMRLSPRDPTVGVWRVLRGDAELGRGRYDTAIAEYRGAIETGFRTYAPFANMAAAYALAGRIDEARSALQEARRLNPRLTVDWLMSHGPSLRQLADGTRKAGLPEI